MKRRAFILASILIISLCGCTVSPPDSAAEEIVLYSWKLKSDDNSKESRGTLSFENRNIILNVKKTDKSELNLNEYYEIDDEKIMDAAFLMKESGVDVLTFPDSPSGRTRADSILMAEKDSREKGMCVMPHICCRDKNAIAMRSQLLGAHINDINNFLVITGDPIPSVVRASVKSVFNFDSVGLMNIISDMNQEQFAGEPVIYGGAINQGRVNFKVELERVKKKMEAGATFFMTQPVFSDEDIDRLRQIKEQTGARILCGIMPFVSLRNATFMKNEMTGINVTDEILSRYRADMSKEEGGIQIAREIIAKTTDFVDGYYFSFPFNRVHMLKKIIGKNNQ